MILDGKKSFLVKEQAYNWLQLLDHPRIWMQKRPKAQLLVYIAILKIYLDKFEVIYNEYAVL